MYSSHVVVNFMVRIYGNLVEQVLQNVTVCKFVHLPFNTDT